MTDLVLNNERFFIDIKKYRYNSSITFNSSILYEKNLNHLVVFCGKGLTKNLCEAINELAILLRETNTIIALTDRGDLDNKEINKYVHKIPLSISENNVPKGIKAENFLFCEIKSIEKYIKNLGISNIEYFTRMRKDIYLNKLVFINYLQSVKSLNKKYKFITVTESTNILRRFCISDMFFTIPFSYIGKIPYRIKPNKRNLFWFNYRHLNPYEIFKNDHQMEQWVWFNLLKETIPHLKESCSLKDYWLYLHTNILIFNPSQIGYIWNRSSDFYLNNWHRFDPNGHGLMKTSKPFRDFFNYSPITSNLLIHNTKLSNYFFNSRKIIFIKKLLFLILTFPFYYLKYLIEH